MYQLSAADNEVRIPARSIKKFPTFKARINDKILDHPGNEDIKPGTIVTVVDSHLHGAFLWIENPRRILPAVCLDLSDEQKSWIVDI